MNQVRFEGTSHNYTPEEVENEERARRAVVRPRKQSLIRSRVFRNGSNGHWTAQMIDTNDGSVWSEANGDSRNEALIKARQRMPSKSVIRQKRGWAVRHPFATGALVAGGAMLFMPPDEQGNRPDAGTVIAAAIIGGILGLVVRNILVPPEERE